MPPRLPEKIYFKIGEVSQIVGVEPYVLRYWETEFDLLKPAKAPSKHRLYKKRDVELLLDIKRLLYSEGFTIEEADGRVGVYFARHGARVADFREEALLATAP